MTPRSVDEGAGISAYQSPAAVIAPSASHETQSQTPSANSAAARPTQPAMASTIGMP
ncbi:hypothetical protein B551_0218890 [Cupriavidus sp. HPC(L)]|nr:hypothetical protein B551_0218890 [Cupriavidus sp. HPC(L)]